MAMPNDFINKTITIGKIESQQFENGGTQYKITADGVKYKFSTTKREGGETVAYRQFLDLGLKVGMIIDISYKEVAKTYQDKPYTDRLIMTFRESPKSMSTSEIPSVKNGNDAFGRRLALHGFINARLANHTIDQVKAELEALLELEDAIGRALEIKPSGEDSEFQDIPF